MANDRLVKAEPEPNVAFYGYQIGKNSYLVVAVYENKSYAVSIYDPRIAAAPIIVGVSHIWAETKKLLLPNPDFTSKGAREAFGGVVDFSNSDNAMRNLKTDGLFTVTAEKVRRSGRVYETQLFPFRKILAAGRSVRYLIGMVPPISEDFPFRRFQFNEIADGHSIFSVIDTNAVGESKTLSLFQRNDGEFFRLQGDWVNFDNVTGPVVYSRTDERKVILQGDKILFHVGEHVPDHFNLIELERSKTLYTRPLYEKGGRSIDPDWDRLAPPKEKLNTSDLSDALSYYGVLNFLVESKKMHRALSPEAHKIMKESHNDDPFVNYSIAQWRPYQKLQVSPLGVMTYQESSSQSPLFLGLVGNNPPVDITTVAGRLRITFELGNATDYDLKTGEAFPVLRSNMTSRMCLSLF